MSSINRDVTPKLGLCVPVSQKSQATQPWPAFQPSCQVTQTQANNPIYNYFVYWFNSHLSSLEDKLNRHPIGAENNAWLTVGAQLIIERVAHRQSSPNLLRKSPEQINQGEGREGGGISDQEFFKVLSNYEIIP